MRMIPRSPLCLAATLLALLPLQPTRADQGDVTITLSPEAPHARSHVWQISYAWPDQTTCAKIELSYKYWDASEDGDVPAKKLLNSSPMKNNGSFLSFSVHLTKEQSLLVLGNNNLGIVGHGFPLDASFVLAKHPKANADGYYILAQQSIDPKNPVAMGDTGEASAWIELSIEPQ